MAGPGWNDGVVAWPSLLRNGPGGDEVIPDVTDTSGCAGGFGLVKNGLCAMLLFGEVDGDGSDGAARM